MCFVRNRSSYSFESCTIVISMPENLRMCWGWPSKWKGKWCFSLKMCFLRNGSSYHFETCNIVNGRPENLWLHWVWSLKYKGRWCFSLKFVFSEKDHHTALKCVPLWLAWLKTWGSLSLILLFSQKGIIIQLWNLYHCDQHAWEPQGVLRLTH